MTSSPNASGPGLHPQRALPNVSPATANRILKHPIADQPSSATGTAAPVVAIADAGSRPGAIRTHASVPADDVLQSLADCEERDRRISAGKKLPAAVRSEGDETATLKLTRRKSVAYDPQPFRRPLLDIMA